LNQEDLEHRPQIMQIETKKFHFRLQSELKKNHKSKKIGKNKNVKKIGVNDSLTGLMPSKYLWQKWIIVLSIF
jgi:hypothetical protein